LQQEAILNVVAKNLYNQDLARTPIQNGVLDRRMGVSQKNATCDTCYQGLNECVGHFGYLDLALPVFHVGHFRSTITILQSICKMCSHVLLKEEDKKLYSKKMSNPQLSYLAKKSLHGQILKKAKKNLKCLNCFNVNGPVKKGAGLMKIVHEPFRGKKLTDPLMSCALDEMAAAANNNKELIQCINPSSLAEELNPLQVYDLFSNIPKVCSSQ
jgi:DNA-directed RNA polymerase III subunit RPC1